MIKAQYVTGEHIELVGEEALIRPGAEDGFVLAQFDRLSLLPWSHGWHALPRSSFSAKPFSKRWGAPFVAEDAAFKMVLTWAEQYGLQVKHWHCTYDAERKLLYIGADLEQAR